MADHPCKCCECKSADLREKLKISNYEIYHDIILIYCTAAVDFAKIAINSILILNGAAGVAVLYNLKSFGEHGFELLRSYALGALLAIVCSGVSYATQLINAIVYMQNPDILDGHCKIIAGACKNLFAPKNLRCEIREIRCQIKKPFKIGIILMIASCFAWGGSVGFFCSATYSTFAFLEKQGNGQSMDDLFRCAKSQSPIEKSMVYP